MQNTREEMIAKYSFKIPEMSLSPELLSLVSIELSEVRPFLKSDYTLQFSVVEKFESHLPLTLMVHLPIAFDPYLKTIEPDCGTPSC